VCDRSSRQEFFDVEGARGPQPGGCGPVLRPTVARAIPGELDSISVGVVDKHSLQHVEVDCPADRDPSGLGPADAVRQLGPRLVSQGEMVESRITSEAARRSSRPACPKLTGQIAASRLVELHGPPVPIAFRDGPGSSNSVPLGLPVHFLDWLRGLATLRAAPSDRRSTSGHVTLRQRRSHVG
jgi:hypothetical protein